MEKVKAQIIRGQLSDRYYPQLNVIRGLELIPVVLILVFFLCVIRILSNMRHEIKTAVLMIVRTIEYYLYEFDKTKILCYPNKYALFFTIGIILGRYFDSVKNYLGLFRPRYC